MLNKKIKLPFEKKNPIKASILSLQPNTLQDGNTKVKFMLILENIHVGSERGSRSGSEKKSFQIRNTAVEVFLTYLVQTLNCSWASQIVYW